MKKRAAKKQPPRPTITLSEQELLVWLRDHIGETKHEAFAAELGISRQRLSLVLNGRSRPGPGILRKLKPLGLVGVRHVYVVQEPAPAVVQ